MSYASKDLTRDGLPVRLYAVDGGSGFSVHGAIKNKDGWSAECWQADGTYSPVGFGFNDLVEVKPRIRREYWVNVYSNCMGSFYEKYSDCEQIGTENNAMARVKVVIDCEVGEGLDIMEGAECIDERSGIHGGSV
jgi:hypothetical protein